MSDCAKYQEYICALVDEELNNSDRAALMAHIAECSECKAMYSAFAAVSGAIAEDMAEVPEALHENIMAGVRRSAMVKNNSRRNMRHTKSMIAAAACFAVVLMSAIGISGALSARRNAVITSGSEMAVVAEAPIKNIENFESEEIVPAPTVKPAEVPAQVQSVPTATASPVITAAPVQTADPYAGTSAPNSTPAAAVQPTAAPAQDMSAPKTTIAPIPTTVPVAPVSTAVPETAAIPQIASMDEAQAAEPVYSEAPIENKAAEAPASEAADAPALASVPAPAAEPVITEEENTAAEEAPAVTASPRRSLFRSAPAVQSETADDADDAAPASLQPSEKLGHSIMSFFSLTEPAATEAPQAELEKALADITVDFRDKKNYEELAKLLTSKTADTLPEGSPDKTYCFIILNGNMELRLLVYSYGNKLYYTIYDELIEQPVYAVSCTQDELEKLIETSSAKVTPDPIVSPAAADDTAADSFSGESTASEGSAKNDGKISVANSTGGISVASSGTNRVTVK